MTAMNILKSCVLMELLVPVTCSVPPANQTSCYILDGILMLYCIVVTGLLFKEKLSNNPDTAELDEGDDDLYQELIKQGAIDDYDVLNPVKVKTKKAKIASTEDK